MSEGRVNITAQTDFEDVDLNYMKLRTKTGKRGQSQILNSNNVANTVNYKPAKGRQD